MQLNGLSECLSVYPCGSSPPLLRQGAEGHGIRCASVKRGVRALADVEVEVVGSRPACGRSGSPLGAACRAASARRPKIILQGQAADLGVSCLQVRASAAILGGGCEGIRDAFQQFQPPLPDLVRVDLELLRPLSEHWVHDECRAPGDRPGSRLPYGRFFGRRFFGAADFSVARCSSGR